MSPFSDQALHAAVAKIHSIQNRSHDYKQAIQQNHECCQMTASLLSDQVADALLTSCSEEEKEEIEKFIEEQKKRLIALAEQNVFNDRDVDTFLKSLANIQQSMIQKQCEGNEDFEKVIQVEMKDIQQRSASTQLELHQEQTVRDIYQVLGMQTEVAPAGAEDDLEIIPTQNQQSLKCPLSGAILEDPVKNRVCKHVYSKSSLVQYLQQNRGRNARCPVAGCLNSHLTMESCEPDVQMAMRVKKDRRREARERELRASQAVEFDDEEEEFLD